jgi:large subunit ribosomal protein L17
MRHLNSGRKLSRNSSHRWAMMRNMVTSLLREEKIQTTDPKAKELRRWVDRVITLGKEGSLHARRQALAIIQDKTVVHKLFETIATRFKTRPGGYTRIIKIGRRHGDAAPVSLIELVAGADEAAESATGQEKKAKKKSRKTAAKKASGRRKNAKEASA